MRPLCSDRKPALLLIAILLFAGTPMTGTERGKSFFPYPIFHQRLENGLDVIVIETAEFKNVLSYNTLVLAGSRNEIEKGKSGLAHLFEHILFRHKYGGELNGYDHAINRLGAHNNAWTWFDVTYYHPLTFTQNLDRQADDLPGLLELEASRFTNLAFDRKIFEIEAGAVLGEYRRVASNPGLRMQEKLLELAFPSHPYGHTTIGFYDDVLDMPNEYQAAVRFYETYYRPNNCVMVVAGDVKQEEIMRRVQKAYGHWEPRKTPAIPAPKPMKGPKKAHVPWDADVPPRVYVAYRMPRFQSASQETAVAELLPELLVSDTAPLYRTLRFEKQLASGLSFSGGNANYESFDSRLLVVNATLFKDQFEERGTAYLDEVINDIVAATRDLASFSKQDGAAQLLENLASRYRYDFLAQLSTPAEIAQNFAWFYRFERDPNVFDNLMASVEGLMPEHFDAFAKKYFNEKNRVIVTLAYEESTASQSASKGGSR